MHCTSCGAEVPHGSKFCGECGSALPRANRDSRYGTTFDRRVLNGLVPLMIRWGADASSDMLRRSQSGLSAPPVEPG